MSGLSFLRVATRDALALTQHLLLYPTGIREERTAERADTDCDDPLRLPTEGRSAPPVLLLHGFCDNRSTFVLLRRSLLRNGWPHVFALNHSLLTWDIRAAAAQLEARVEEICARTGHSRVDIVGHSLGGLIGRYYAQARGGDARVRTLVTLGTPHAGTHAAFALPPHPVARQMRPRSDLLEELALPAADCRTRFVSIWSDVDLFMVPVENARLDHPDLSACNVRVHDVGHLMLPVDRDVTARIRKELGGAPGADATGTPSAGVA